MRERTKRTSASTGSILPTLGKSLSFRCSPTSTLEKSQEEIDEIQKMIDKLLR